MGFCGPVAGPADTDQLRLGVVCDFPEEDWPSMDFCAEMLLQEWKKTVRAEALCPLFRHRFGRLPIGGKLPSAFNADRFVNRHYDYPRFLRHRVADFDFFHIVDHSYAHLALGLPAGRVGVYCHDLDTFRCLLEPRREPRSFWFRRMARRKLEGLQKAAVVFHTTMAIRKQIETYGLVDPTRLVHAPNGVGPEFTPAEELTNTGSPFLLHVGSCIPRKRIDVLLDIFAVVRKRHPEIRLVQVGGTWTAAQREQIDRLGVGDALTQVRGLPRREIADLYRRAAVLLLPSEAEGFGLPLVEALACGTVAAVSDLPVLREVGGAAGVYLPVGDVDAWARGIDAILDRPELAPPKELWLRQAAKYSWAEHARIIRDAYLKLAR